MSAVKPKEPNHGDSDVQPDPYIDTVAVEHGTEYEPAFHDDLAAKLLSLILSLSREDQLTVMTKLAATWIYACDHAAGTK